MVNFKIMSPVVCDTVQCLWYPWGWQQQLLLLYIVFIILLYCECFQSRQWCSKMKVLLYSKY